MNSLKDFRKGSFADGGANDYIARDGSIRLINLWDFNGDGDFDIPVTCPQDYTETPDIFIYWSGQDGFSADRRTSLPAEGALAATASDLNKDGFTDLVVCNRFDGEKNNLDSYIYWGSSNGFSAGNRSGLTTEAAEDAAVADLNNDGYPDIVFANNGSDYHMTVDKRQQSYIYWGSANGYDRSSRTQLKTAAAMGVELADLNSDGSTDIAFAMEGNTPQDGGVTIYYNNGKGAFSGERSLSLPGLCPSNLAVGDLDKDGYHDLLLVNRCEMKNKPAPGYRINIKTTDVNSFIYWGSKGGFSSKRRTELPSPCGSGAAIGDLNNDGLPDVVLTCGRSTLMMPASSQRNSFIYWNSPQGFSPANRTALETNSAMGCAVADLNSDGYSDIVFSNHSEGGSFNTDSYIYWGSASGFTSDRRSSIPTQGAFGVTLADMNGDGREDIVSVNKREGRLPAAHLFVYQGNDQGQFSAEKRWEVPGRDADLFAVFDLDVDGYSDLLFPNAGGVVYWGSKSGLSARASRQLNLPCRGYTAMPADFDRDGWLDLALGADTTSVLYGSGKGILSSRVHVLATASDNSYIQVADLDDNGWLDIIGTMPSQDCLMIHWNSKTGFTSLRQSKLKMHNSCGLRIADLNKDGCLDIVAFSEADLRVPAETGHRPLYGGNPRFHMSIFWGSKGGFSDSNVTKLPTIGADDCVISDLNLDGWLDIAVTSYHGGDHRHFPGYIYWNAPDGFSPDRRSIIPMNSGCGIFAADLNLDSFPDLVWANHCIVGDHRSFVSVAYGSASGLGLAGASKLPATGPHYFNFSDIGNLWNRSDRFDYVSPPFDTGPAAELGRIVWEADTPRGTAVEFQVRCASTRKGLMTAPWKGPAGGTDYYRESGALLSETRGQRWIQYKASLISRNQASTPVLRSVSLEY